MSNSARHRQRFYNSDLSLNDQRQLIKAYDDLVQSKINAGWSPFLITVMFAHLRGSAQSKLHQMHREIERIYDILLGHVVRDPNSKCVKPILIGMADLPVYKRKKKSPLSDIIVNDGLHFHAILLVPPKSRLRTPVDEHFCNYSSKYLGDRRTLDRIDVVQITTGTSRKVTDYIFKQLKRGFSFDDVLILPKARSEMSSAKPAASDLYNSNAL